MIKNILLSGILLFPSCNSHSTVNLQSELQGTWQLLSSETFEGDSVSREALSGRNMIKIITPTHFAFFYHDLAHGRDSTNAVFVSGGGTCSFTDSTYSEHLEFCNYREWEDLDVTFRAVLKGDTLVLRGQESKSDIGVNHLLVERYIKVRE